MSALLVGTASAQSTLEWMVLSHTSGSGPGAQNLYTVPAGYRFLLTDLEWSPNMDLSAGTFANIPLTLQSAIAGGTTEVAAWYAALYTSPFGGTQTANIPLSVHWTSGIVFAPGSTVRLALGSMPSAIAWHINMSGRIEPISVGAVQGTPDKQLGLDIAPNPTTNAARITFELARSSKVVLGIFDVQGRRVRTLYNGDLAAGPHALEWDGHHDDGRIAHDGIYWAQLETPTETRRDKVARLR